MDAEIKGVFSTSRERRQGDGTTSRVMDERLLWFVVRVGESFQTSALADNRMPSGIRKMVPGKDFEAYRPEPDVYLESIRPHFPGVLDKLGETDEESDLPGMTREERSLFKALQISIKGGSSSRMSVARELLRRAERERHAWSSEQAMRLSGMAVAARKSSDPVAAVKNYREALRLNPHDDHLYFNMARALYDMGEMDTCRQALRRSLSLNPELRHSREFLAFLEAVGQD
ncbi:tetratricopeptide repeat protein [Desulfohalovibrio reitneri]|uniref:tetratricopeptide repeat protein n=1 Tax=Desulfohalovibrio reitneri TaxID=1307759 RepID=UPI0004A6E2D8|nr:tetratricopeptide repeat protein [Desulfohalovibrio reitneri]